MKIKSIDINMSFDIKKIQNILASKSETYTVHVIKLTSLRNYKYFKGNENHWMNEIRSYVNILKNTKLKSTNKLPEIDKVIDKLFLYSFDKDEEEDIINSIHTHIREYDHPYINWKDLKQYLLDNIDVIRDRYLKFNEFLIKKIKEYRIAYNKLK